MSLLASLIQPVSQILDKAIPDQDLKRKLSHELATMADQHAQQALLAQLEINKAEAASGSLFKGGWRPFVGWVCGVAFCYHFILQPVIVFIVALTGAAIPDLPEFQMNTLLTVLGGLLGIGGLRTYEKQKGLTK
jgi:hypothetical protein|tara:strand:+ start:816 stop:1217 length:402 start_codon:yes stop_codon:yes gene_type:complete